MPQQAPRKARGRRPGESVTRADIVGAARAEFALRGWEGTSVRAVARKADVDPALVLHYFGSKEELFSAAMTLPFDGEEAIRVLLPGPRSQLGLRLARFFLSMWDDAERRGQMMGLLRAASTSPHAAEMLRETVVTKILGPVAAYLDQPDSELRMSLCGAHLVGLGIARYIVRLEPLASLDPEATAAVVGPVLQRYMTGKLS